jgi:hypothetical protein
MWLEDDSYRLRNLKALLGKFPYVFDRLKEWESPCSAKLRGRLRLANIAGARREMPLAHLGGQAARWNPAPSGSLADKV